MQGRNFLDPKESKLKLSSKITKHHKKNTIIKEATLQPMKIITIQKRAKDLSGLRLIPFTQDLNRNY